MPAIRALTAAWTRLSLAPSYEEDPGFRDVVRNLSARGLMVIGLLGIGSVVFYVVAHLLFVGTAITMFVGPNDPPTSISLWDLLVIVSLCVASLFTAASPLHGRGGRLLASIIVLAAALALLMDDVDRGTLLNTPMYLIVVMLCAVGAMPFRPVHTLLLCVSITGMYLYFAIVNPLMMETPMMAGTARRIIPLFITTIICAGISALLYRTRYEQYRAFQRAETLKAQVMEQSDKLVEMERTKARFFTNVSHEFRTPLTLILGPIEDALRDIDEAAPPKHRRRLGIAQRNALRLQQLVGQLLDLSKLESGGMVLRTRRQDLVGFLRNVVVWLSPLAERQQIMLQFQPEQEPLVADFDAEKMEKVVFNLLSNALKFTSPHGKVLVSARGPGADGGASFVEFSVRDTGSGIEAEKLAHIFDRFYQVDGTTSRLQPGTGIGLSLVKEMVELHGGTVTAESQPGFGSTFTVRLPHPKDAAGDVEAVPPPPTHRAVEWYPVTGADTDEDSDEDDRPVAPGHAPLVLVVDDNPDMRAYVKGVLSEHYRVGEAADGLEALKQARALRPDLVISDVMMSEMDGFALCETLKSDDELRHIPIVLLTARAEEASKIEGLALGADDYLYKPFSAPELLARAENLIELRRALRNYFSGRVFVQASEISVTSAEAAFLEQVRKVAEERLGNSNFGVEWLAEEVHLGARQLQRRLRAALGFSAAGYIRMLRLQRAAQLLAQRAASVSEISYAVGFQNPDYFARVFRQTFGVSPSDYARNAGGDDTTDVSTIRD